MPDENPDRTEGLADGDENRGGELAPDQSYRPPESEEVE